MARGDYDAESDMDVCVENFNTPVAISIGCYEGMGNFRQKE